MPKLELEASFQEAWSNRFNMEKVLKNKHLKYEDKFVALFLIVRVYQVQKGKRLLTKVEEAKLVKYKKMFDDLMDMDNQMNTLIDNALKEESS